VKRTITALISIVALCSCGQEQVKYAPPATSSLVQEFVRKGIDPCRIISCGYSGKTIIETIEVPAQDKGDFIIYPHKEIITVKPVDALPLPKKVEEK